MLLFHRRQQNWTASTEDQTPPTPAPGSRPSRPLGVHQVGAPPPVDQTPSPPNPAPGSRPSRPLGVQQVRAPPPVPCDKKRCCHKIVFGQRFEINAWHNFVRLETQERESRPVADAGLCMVCQQPVPGRRGWKADRSRHFHLFNECAEYPYSRCNRK